MSGNKRAYSDVKKNATIWTQNFKKGLSRCSDMQVLDRSLSEQNRMPKNAHLLARNKYLLKAIKSESSRLDILTKEIVNLWKKLSFPMLAIKSVKRKIKKVLMAGRAKRNRKGVQRNNFLEALFDVTSPDKCWLSNEDKQFYYLQLSSKGKLGYCSSKSADVHPSKKILEKKESPYSKEQFVEFSDSISSKDSNESLFESMEVSRPYNSTSSAVKLVEKLSLKCSTAANVCKTLQQDGVTISSPTASGVHKAVINRAYAVKNDIKQAISKETWALHFDGKRVKGVEHQVVVLKNKQKEVRLAALVLPDGKGKTISDAIAEIIEEYRAWPYIKMLISDSTNANTGRKKGVITLLQTMFFEKGFPRPQFIGCQHHALDLILKHVMNESLVLATSSPEISYTVFQPLFEKFDELVIEFHQQSCEEVSEEKTWREDMDFLLHLSMAYRFYREKGYFPVIHFRKLPNLSNARWNSRAILALLSFILVPESRDELRLVCNFISGFWHNAWFSKQFYDEDIYYKLCYATHTFSAAFACLKRHWVTDPSVIETERSNVCAERAIFAMQKIDARKTHTLNSKFILTNRDIKA